MGNETGNLYYFMSVHDSVVVKALTGGRLLSQSRRERNYLATFTENDLFACEGVQLSILRLGIWKRFHNLSFFHQGMLGCNDDIGPL